MSMIGGFQLNPYGTAKPMANPQFAGRRRGEPAEESSWDTFTPGAGKRGGKPGDPSTPAGVHRGSAAQEPGDELEDPPAATGRHRGPSES